MSRLEQAIRIDYTGSAPGFHQFDGYSDKVAELIRASRASISDGKTLVVIDRGFNLPDDKPCIVTDHLNFTGDNPLVGPNPDCGERFPVVNDVYLELHQTTSPNKTLPLKNPLSRALTGIAAGIKSGVEPAAAELEKMSSLGADFYCYNVVPTMLVAAHAGYKVFALALPEGRALEPESISYLKGE